MKKDNFKTKVIFRKFKDDKDIIALFPDIKNGDYVLSYMHIGQHSDANYKHCLKITNKAKKHEYQNLKNELQNLCGYDLDVIE